MQSVSTWLRLLAGFQRNATSMRVCLATQAFYQHSAPSIEHKVVYIVEDTLEELYLTNMAVWACLHHTESSVEACRALKHLLLQLVSQVLNTFVTVSQAYLQEWSRLIISAITCHGWRGPAKVTLETLLSWPPATTEHRKNNFNWHL